MFCLPRSLVDKRVFEHRHEGTRSCDSCSFRDVDLLFSIVFGGLITQFIWRYLHVSIRLLIFAEPSQNLPQNSPAIILERAFYLLSRIFFPFRQILKTFSSLDPFHLSILTPSHTSTEIRCIFYTTGMIHNLSFKQTLWLGLFIN